MTKQGGNQEGNLKLVLDQYLKPALDKASNNLKGQGGVNIQDILQADGEMKMLSAIINAAKNITDADIDILNILKGIIDYVSQYNEKLIEAPKRGAREDQGYGTGDGSGSGSDSDGEDVANGRSKKFDSIEFDGFGEDHFNGGQASGPNGRSKGFDPIEFDGFDIDSDNNENSNLGSDFIVGSAGIVPGEGRGIAKSFSSIKLNEEEYRRVSNTGVDIDAESDFIVGSAGTVPGKGRGIAKSLSSIPITTENSLAKKSEEAEEERARSSYISKISDYIDGFVNDSGVKEGGVKEGGVKEIEGEPDCYMLNGSKYYIMQGFAGNYKHESPQDKIDQNVMTIQKMDEDGAKTDLTLLELKNLASSIDNKSINDKMNKVMDNSGSGGYYHPSSSISNPTAKGLTDQKTISKLNPSGRG